MHLGLKQVFFSRLTWTFFVFLFASTLLVFFQSNQQIFEVKAAAPNPPTTIFPADTGSVYELKPALQLTYQDTDGDPGSIEVRVSSGSQANCQSGVLIVSEGSASTSSGTLQDVAVILQTPLINATTYEWCARTFDGVTYSAWTDMGQFTVNVIEEFIYSSYLGGTSFESATSTIYKNGSPYMLGTARSPEFPTTAGVYQTVLSTGDVYVVKFRSNLDGIELATFYGAAGNDVEPYNFDVDPSGNVYVVGYDCGANLPGMNGFDLVGDAANCDGFMVKFNNTLSSISYGTYLGDSVDYEEVKDIVAPTSDGVVHMLSYAYNYAGSTTVLTPNGFDIAQDGSGSDDAIYQLIDTTQTGASSVLYGTFVEGNGNIYPQGGGEELAVDSSGNAYLLLGTDATDTPTTATTYDSTYNGGTNDMAIIGINPELSGASSLVYGTYIGGSDREFPRAIALHTNGNIYITGETRSADFPFNNEYDNTLSSTTDGFLSVIDQTVNGSGALIYSSLIGGNSTVDSPRGLGIDASGNAFISGHTNATAGFPLVNPVFSTHPTSGSVVFFSEFNPSLSGGASLLNSTLTPWVVPSITRSFFDVSTQRWFGHYTHFSATADQFTTSSAYQPQKPGSNDSFIFSYAAGNVPPNLATRVSPLPYSATVVDTTPILIVNYTDPESDAGTVAFRVSSSSLSDCESGTNLIDSGSVSSVASGSQASYTLVSALTENSTYYWCVRTSDSNSSRGFEPMGMLTVNADDLEYSSYLGGAQFDQTRGIAVSNTGNIFITGDTRSTAFPTTAGVIEQNKINNNVTDDIFVTKISPTFTLLASTFIGGDLNDAANDITVDSSGNVYLAGVAQSANFPIVNGIGVAPDTFSLDAFVMKVNGSLTSILYSSLIAGVQGVGDNDDQFFAIEVDSLGNIYAAGQTSSTDMTLPAAFNDNTNVGDTRAGILHKFNPMLSGGASHLYGTYIDDDTNNGSIQMFGNAMDLSGTDSVFMCFATGAVNPTTANAYSATLSYAFIVQYDLTQASGSQEVYASYHGGAGSGSCESIKYNTATGNVYLAGYVSGANAPVTGSAYQSTLAGDADMFVSVFDVEPGSTTLVYGSHLGGAAGAFTSANDYVGDMDIDSTGNKIYLLGYSASTDFDLKNAFDSVPPTVNPGKLVFAEFDISQSGANSLTRSGYFFSPAPADTYWAMHVGPNGNVYFGAAAGDGLAVTSNAYQSTYQGSTDAFITKLATGTAFNTGGSSPSIQQEKVSNLNEPHNAGALSITPDQVQFRWDYYDDFQLGFRIYDETDANIHTDPDPNQRIIVLDGFTPNTLYSGYSVSSYSLTKESAHIPFNDFVTLIPNPTPVLVERGPNSVTVSIEQELDNLAIGDSGLQFELTKNLSEPTSAAEEVITSGWIQEDTYTFEGVSLTDAFEIRVVARNQEANESAWSEPLVSEEVVVEENGELDVTISVLTIQGQPILGPLPVSEPLSVSIIVNNRSLADAENVVASVFLPNYLVYAEGTLEVNGEGQSGEVDEDLGISDTFGLSGVLPLLEAGETMTMRFQVFFDEDALRLLANSENPIQPTILLSGSVVASNVEGVASTQVLQLLPDITPLVEPVPDEVIPEETEETVDSNDQPQNQPDEEQVPPAEGIDQPQDLTEDVEEEEIALSSTAQVTETQIVFSGVTVPESDVTVTINSIYVFQAQSNQEGVWQVFVNAEELGLAPGQSAYFTTVVVAEKDGRTSAPIQERVFVAQANEATQPTSSVTNATTTEMQVLTAIDTFLTENESTIQTTLGAAVPVVLISSAPLWGYIPYFPALVYHFVSYLIGLLGRRKQDDQKDYGIVYDAITKEPVSLAVVRVYKEAESVKKLLTTIVTDAKGRFDLLLDEGVYHFDVKKPQYRFPSKIITAKEDGSYSNLYNNEAGLLVEASGGSVPDIAIDPIDAQRNFNLANVVKKGWLILQRVGHYLVLPVLFIGSLASAAVLISVPDSPENWILTALYVLLLTLQLRLRPIAEKAWGVVYDLATSAPLPLATIQLISPEYGKVVKSRLTDYQGRFSFLPDPGNYQIKAAKEGYQQIDVMEAPQTKYHPIEGEIAIQKEGERIKGDIPMKQA